nr:hypothetical protein [Sphingobium sp. DC-2]
MQGKAVLAARDRRVGRQKAAAQGEGTLPQGAIARKAHIAGKACILRLYSLETDIGVELHARVAIPQGRAGQQRSADQWQVERLAFFVGIAKGPCVVPAVAGPFEVSCRITKFEPSHTIFLSEDEAERSNPRVDEVGAEKIRATCPRDVRNRHPLGTEPYVDWCEIELEVTSHPNLALKPTGQCAFERLLQEPPFGDEQDQPDGEYDRDDPQ